MLRKVGLAVIAALISTAVPASALTYDFTFQGGALDPTVSGSGTFTTNAANNLVISGSGAFSIGLVSGQTTLFPVTADTSGLSAGKGNPIDRTPGIWFQARDT